jgi:ParB/RepB/Spo0J family partition protein
MTIKLEDIEIKYNPRTRFEGIDELARSIKELGILQPLTVAKNGNGKYALLDGQRRLLACRKIGLKEVPVIERDLDEEQQKEVPIATDFFKDKLKFSEKVIGVANLINREKKLTEDVLAKRYGWTVAEVKRLLKLATLHPEVLIMIDAGQLKATQALELTKVKREDIQIKLAGCMVQKQWFGLTEALEEIAFELPFDDIFTYEQAKKDNKVGIVVADDERGDRVFTYDKEYFEQKKKEYEEREKKTYAKQEKKAQKRHENELAQEKENKAATKEERKKQREQAKSTFDTTLSSFQELTVRYLTVKPTEEEIGVLVNKFVRLISMDNCKLILKAFGVTFKSSEMQSADYKDGTVKVIGGIVKNESDLAKLILYVGMLGEIYKTTMFDIDGVKKMIVKMSK